MKIKWGHNNVIVCTTINIVAKLNFYYFAKKKLLYPIARRCFFLSATSFTKDFPNSPLLQKKNSRLPSFRAFV